MLRTRTLVVALLSLLLTACVPFWQQRPDSSPESLWDARYTDLVQLDRWEIKGRTVITQGNEAWNAGLYWQEDRGSYQIKLLGPFAQGGVTLDGDEGQVTLTMADGTQSSSPSPEALIAETLGIHLPVSALRDWVRGIPYQSTNFKSIEYDAEGRITHLVQQGWDVKFLRYIPFENYSMPAKIFIKHDEFSLRLVISDWELIQ